MYSGGVIAVTGGAGFIGSTLVRQLLRETDCRVVNIDKLTYAGNLESLADVAGSAQYHFERADIVDGAAMRRLFHQYRPDAVMHLAAESHVDRSIDSPADFIHTNIIGTSVLLDVTRDYLKTVDPAKRDRFRFLHVSTDEVYGSLMPEECATEMSPYRPNSPYAASKAASDHLVRAWHNTYGLPALITNCGNNFGPYQYPEKLIPLMIVNALAQKPLPVYGDGLNVRDWIYVEDHCRALRRVLEAGVVGSTYLIGASNPLSNLNIVHELCACLDDMFPRSAGGSYRELIVFVPDRPGHDRRYALDASRISDELGWSPAESFAGGLRRTVQWYVDNRAWCTHAMGGRYAGERLGVGT